MCDHILPHHASEVSNSSLSSKGFRSRGERWWGRAFLLTIVLPDLDPGNSSPCGSSSDFMNQCLPSGKVNVAYRMPGVPTACLSLKTKGWAVPRRKVAQGICAVIRIAEHFSDMRRA